MACGECQVHCVLDVSAVKCVQCFAMCGYCDICTGYFVKRYRSLDTVAEEQLCPTAAITRKFVEARMMELADGQVLAKLLERVPDVS